MASKKSGIPGTPSDSARKARSTPGVQIATRTRIDSLTDAERSRFAEWRDRWIEIGLRTGPADREKFERAVRECYACAKFEPPKRIVWVTSPIALAIAAPVASMLLSGAPLVKGGAVGGAVDGAVRGAVRGAVGGAVDGAVDGAVGGAVDGAVRDAVGGAVDGAVGGAVGGAVDGAVRDAVDGAVGGAVRGAVGDAVGGAVRDAVDDAVRGAVGDAVRGAVDGAVGGAENDRAIRQAVSRSIASAWHYYVGGQFWVGGWWWGAPCFVSFFRDVCGLALEPYITRAAMAYQETSESAGWWWPHREFVMVCERPTAIYRDELGRLHCADGMAIAWPDGWGLYRWHGLEVPPDVILHPEAITVDRIHGEQNAELRRILIERYGMSRYVRDAQFKILDEDRDPIGQPRRLLKRDDLLVVELTNSTADADGTRRVYHVPVHPELRPLLDGGQLGAPQKMTALNAVASTYGMRGEEYVLEVET